MIDNSMMMKTKYTVLHCVEKKRTVARLPLVFSHLNSLNKKWHKLVYLTGLRSAVGERRKWSAGGETAGTEPERNAAAEPQTEGRR
jgi:hypothetical protein